MENLAPPYGPNSGDCNSWGILSSGFLSSTVGLLCPARRPERRQ